MLYYSESTRGFYDTSFAKYNLPEDCIEITKDQYKLLHKETLKGLSVKFVNGSFQVSPAELTPDQIKSSEAVWVESELLRANDELDKVQDGDVSAIGSVSSWRTYRKALRSWVGHKDFPNKEFRPVAPDV